MKKNWSQFLFFVIIYRLTTNKAEEFLNVTDSRVRGKSGKISKTVQRIHVSINIRPTTNHLCKN